MNRTSKLLATVGVATVATGIGIGIYWAEKQADEQIAEMTPLLAAPLASVHIVSDPGQLQTLTSSGAIYADPFVFFREANGLMGANVRTGQRVIYRLCTLRGVGGGYWKPIGDSFSCPSWMDYDPATRYILTNIIGGVTAYRGSETPANRAMSVQLLYLTTSGQIQYKGQASSAASFGGVLVPGNFANIQKTSSTYNVVDISTPPGSHVPLMPVNGPFDGTIPTMPRPSSIDGYTYTIMAEPPYDYRHFVMMRQGGGVTPPPGVTLTAAPGTPIPPQASPTCAPPIVCPTCPPSGTTAPPVTKTPTKKPTGPPIVGPTT